MPYQVEHVFDEMHHRCFLHFWGVVFFTIKNRIIGPVDFLCIFHMIRSEQENLLDERKHTVEFNGCETVLFQNRREIIYVVNDVVPSFFPEVDFCGRIGFVFNYLPAASLWTSLRSSPEY